MDDKKVIAVVGATGAQGGGLARAILADPNGGFASFYWDNLYALSMGPKKGDDGVYRWALPMGNKRLAGIAVEDIGKVAYGIFKAGPSRISLA